MKRVWIIIAAVAVLALPAVIAACGGTSQANSSPSPTPTASPRDIVDTAVAAGDFKTLVTALTAAGLDQTLRGAGPFTVFAPTDAAFAAVPKETLDALLADPKGALTNVLTYHVVPGKVMSSDLSNGMEVKTVNGAPITIKVNADGTVQVNDATVTTADIETSNGVIHVIDKVLIPPSK